MDALSITVNGRVERLHSVHEEGLLSTRRAFWRRASMTKHSVVLAFLRTKGVQSLSLKKSAYTLQFEETRREDAYASTKLNDPYNLTTPMAYIQYRCGENNADTLFASVYAYSSSVLLRMYAKKYDRTFWFVRMDKWYPIWYTGDVNMYRKLRSNQLVLVGPHVETLGIVAGVTSNSEAHFYIP